MKKKEIIKRGHIIYNNGIEKNDELYENIFKRFSESICIDVSVDDENKIKREIKALDLYRLKYKHNFAIKNNEYFVDLENEILISLINRNNTTSVVMIQFPCMSDEKNHTRVNALFRIFFKYREKEKKEKSYVNLVTKGTFGYSLDKFDIKDVSFDVEDNYNDDFLEINEIIQKGINNSLDKNLVILQSEPGCGKTYYIRKLIKSNPNLSFVFMHPNLASNITHEGFVSFAISNLKGKVIIIEDAELIISKRGGSINNNGSISTLLNMTDGFMKDILNLKIICTANCKMSDIDEALLRKGRILAKYEFKKLAADKCNKIFQKKGINHLTDEDMTIADVYNVCDLNFNENNSKVGFSLNVE